MSLFRLALASLLFLFSTSAMADSPMTSTVFHQWYAAKYSVVHTAVDGEGYSQEHKAFFAEDTTRDNFAIKAAVVNGLGFDMISPEAVADLQAKATATNAWKDKALAAYASALLNYDKENNEAEAKAVMALLSEAYQQMVDEEDGSEMMTVLMVMIGGHRAFRKGVDNWGEFYGIYKSALELDWKGYAADFKELRGEDPLAKWELDLTGTKSDDTPDVQFDAVVEMISYVGYYYEDWKAATAN